MWARAVRKARLNWIDLRTILTTPAYVKKATLFMQKTGNFEVKSGTNSRRTVQSIKTEYRKLQTKVQDRGYAGGRGIGRIRTRKITQRH